MAQVNSYNQVGKHKSLSDIVETLGREDTPFQSLIGKGTVKDTLFHWVEETLNAAGGNAAVEGADAVDFADPNLAERQNYTQIFQKAVSLTGTSQAVDQAGSLEKMAYQVKMRSLEMKRDAEYAFLNGQSASAGSATTPRNTASFQAQVASDNIIDKAGAAVTEADLNELLIRLYEAGAKPKYVMCHPRIRAALSAILSNGSGRYSDRALNSTINASINEYISDVGTVQIVNNIHCPFGAGAGEILVFDDSMWSVEVLRPYGVHELAKTGDSDKKQIIMEAGLKNKNFSSAGYITGVAI